MALTAWQALVERGNVQPGQKVLIHAGAGGVGSIAIQLAKHLGATVATTASAANADFVRELGADIVIDYRTQDFEQSYRYDLVLDSLGGENLEKSSGYCGPAARPSASPARPTPPSPAQAGLNPVLRLAITALSARSGVRRRSSACATSSCSCAQAVHNSARSPHWSSTARYIPSSDASPRSTERSTHSPSSTVAASGARR